MVEIIKEWLEYNQETGEFTWLQRPSNKVKVGDVAGKHNSCGYIQISLRGMTITGHRLAWWWVHNDLPSIVDHKNRNRADNSIANLQGGGYHLNNRNLALCSRNTSGFKGVDKGENGKFSAHIFFSKKKWFLGTFKNKQDAVEARMYGEMVRDGDISKIRFQEMYGKWIG